MEITDDFKRKVIAALLEARANFEGSDTAFSKQRGINNAVFSRLKKGETTGLLSSAQWLQIGRQLGVNLKERQMKLARTDVYNTIEEEVEFCQTNSKAMIFVDDCEIGKTIAAKHLSRTRLSCFYVDASQAKTKQLFIRSIAKAIGVDNTGRYADVKADIKYYLQQLGQPIIIIDDAGDLELKSFLELKEFWNATEGFCGWYMIGDDSLKYLIEKSITSKKPGFRALFSRFLSNYTRVTPIGKDDRLAFYRNLISQVLEVNMTDKSNLDALVKKCLINGTSGQIGGLRRAESILILNS